MTATSKTSKKQVKAQEAKEWLGQYIAEGATVYTCRGT
jgi:hypothetical protein